MRQAVAALLNYAHPDIEYEFSQEDEVITMFQGAFASGDYQQTEDRFYIANDMACPMSPPLPLELTPTPTDTPTATATDTPIATDTPTATATDTPNATDTPTPTATDTPSASDTPTPTATDTPNASDTPTPTATDTPDATDTPTATATDTPQAIDTSTPTPTDTSTPTITITPTWTWTPSPTEDICASLVLDGFTVDNENVFWDVTNNSAETITITQIIIDWPSEGIKLIEVKFGGKVIWEIGDDAPPTSINSDWSGEDKDRQANPGEKKALQFEFDTAPGSTGFNLNISFDVGCTLHSAK
jgi:hypothetical protein